MARVEFAGVRKTFGAVVAVEGLDLLIGDGAFVSLLGPSGCGKTTTLRMLAGLEFPTGGTITIGDRVVNDVAPAKRDVAMVFQSYALYPHMSVAENMAYPLRKRGVPRGERDAKVRAVATMLQLDALLGRRPRELSGGQQQRVALGRALVREPQVFLFDEPLSNLDAKLRAHMRAELIELRQKIGQTMVYVTHDQLEAMTMSDRIAVHAERGAPAVRVTGGDLPLPGQPVRGRVHRHAVDELRRGRAGAGRRAGALPDRAAGGRAAGGAAPGGRRRRRRRGASCSGCGRRT